MIPAWDTATGRGLGDRVAAWAQTNAEAFGITVVIWNDRVWSPGRAGEGWRPYTHPNGATGNATLRHLDHVHISVSGTAGTYTGAATTPGGGTGTGTGTVHEKDHR